MTDRLLDSATSFATMGPLGLISDTLGGWLSKGDEHVAQTDNKTAAISTPQHGEATKNNALDFVKNNVINELNLATGTAAAFAANQGMTTSKIHGVSKAGDLAGRALNAHTVWETLNNDGLSVKEKAAGIGSTLGGMFSADAVSGALSKSKNPYVRMAAPMAGYLTNNMVGDAIKGWFSDDKTSATNEAKAPDPNSLNQLNVSANKASEHSSAPQPGAASVTVNANITVNANDGQQAYEVAQQVKQMLDQQQQQAEQELSARYYNQVA